MTSLMRRRPFLVKWGLPYVFVALILLWDFHKEPAKTNPDYLSEGIACLVAFAVLFFVIKRQNKIEPDAVLDGGAFLQVTFGDATESIPISNLANVEIEKTLRLTRLYLRLRVPSQFGQTISFYPIQKNDSSGQNSVAASLQGRISSASRMC